VNEFKGTPGPWHWNNRYLGLRNRELKRDVLHHEPYEGLALRPYGESTEAKEERAANARLIKAAPLLLKALQELEEAARQVMAGEMAPSSIMIERMKAQDAITEALGK
jgi:hypothetical protein